MEVYEYALMLGPRAFIIISLIRSGIRVNLRHETELAEFRPGWAKFRPNSSNNGRKGLRKYLCKQRPMNGLKGRSLVCKVLIV